MRVIDTLKRIKNKVRATLLREPLPLDAWSDPAYGKWFLAHKASDSELELQRKTRFDLQPKFSIIVPLFKTPIDYLTKMAESVLAQTYNELELILVNASPEDAELAAAVEAIIDFDSRVREVRLDCNHGITENTNRGMGIASGEFFCFLDHDDFIEPDLLFEYAKALNDDPDIDVLYCDEDLVKVENGKMHHMHPLFKPSYSPELLLCKNYIVHMMAVRSTIAQRMPKPDSSYDGAQDYNMILFATTVAKRVHCVQKVLYHWRISDNSTAANPHAKPYSRRAYRKSAFNRIAQDYPSGMIISSGIINIHDVWFGNTGSPSVSIIVDCGDDPDSLGVFLEELAQSCDYPVLEIVPVGCKAAGNAIDSAVGSLSPMRIVGGGLFERLDDAASEATGDFLLFVDSHDTFATPDAICQLSGLCSNEGIGAAAAKCLYSDTTVKNFGIAATPERIMPLYRGYPDDFPAYQCNTRAFQNLSAVSWQGMMVDRELFLRVDGFERAYCGEIGSADFCQKLLHEGLRIVQTPTVKIQTSESAPEPHYNSGTNSEDFTESDLQLFDRRWPGTRAAGDPYFNRNLDQSSGYYQLDASFR